tara:strand:- start:4379 stop:5770 length:1392 start_codon:yes stop_codon:yes gene_type:complete
MIGKAIHKILLGSISDLESGNVIPVVIPQQPKDDYPQVIYGLYNEMLVSKDKNPNIKCCDLSLRIVGKTYKSCEDLARKIRDILDHLEDHQTFGIDGIPSYKDENGYTHNPIGNLHLNHVFFEDENEIYLDNLYQYERIQNYKVWYFDNLGVLSYDSSSATPIFAYIDFSESTLGQLSQYWSIPVTDGNSCHYFFQQICKPSINNLTVNSGGQDVSQFHSYWGTTPSTSTRKPNWFAKTNSLPGYLEFVDNDIFMQRTFQSDYLGRIPTLYGAMVIYLYRPVDDGNNYISGNSENTSTYQPLINHSKSGSNIGINFNPSGINVPGDNVTFVSTTDNVNYWDPDMHFLAISYGGRKEDTGGTKNAKGWFEYFNSDYNPKLTTGQILNNNSFAGNTSTYTDSMSFGTLGSWTLNSAKFRIYEMIFCASPDNSKRGNDLDNAPFQPSDLIYSKIKEYVYNKYENLK